MHARDLVEVAGLVALNGPLLVAGGRPPCVSHLEQYWSASKCRAEGWSRALKACASLSPSNAMEDYDAWIGIRSAIDEIFASEILTRVWTAVLVAADCKNGSNTSGPIARSVFTSHMEARHRAMALLVHAAGFSAEQAITINRLRRRSERWTDVLLGGLLHTSDIREFAVEADRAEDFARDLEDRQDGAGGQHAWRLTLMSLRNAFRNGVSLIAASPDANARITAGILGCFPAELFDSTGLFKSLWMLRLSANASDAQGLIGDLLQPRLPEPKVKRHPSRPRRRI